MASTGEQNIDEEIYSTSAEEVRNALSKGANPNYIREKINFSGLPAMSFAIQMFYSEVVDIFKAFLADPRTDVNLEGQTTGDTPLHCCCYLLNDDTGSQLVALLLEHPQIEVNIVNAWKLTVLHNAVSNHKVKSVKLLVEDERVDVNALEIGGLTPLYYAVLKGHLDCVKILLTSPTINPNILSKGQTPLHLAHSQNKKLLVVELLKDNRVDPTIPDKDGNVVSTQLQDTGQQV